MEKALSLSVSFDGLRNKGRGVISIGVFATICSYIFSISTGCFNGDFSSTATIVSVEILTIILIITLVPYLTLYFIYIKAIKSYLETPNHINFKERILRNLTWLMIGFSIMLSLMDYGRLGQGETSLSTDNPISILQSIIYKICSFPWLIVYVVIARNKKDIFLTYILAALASIVKLSLGGIFTLILLQVYKVNFCSRIFKKYLIVCMLGIFLIPNLVSFLYNIRTELRHGRAMQEVTASELVFDRLCGRISSYSNNGVTLQNIPYIIAIKNQYPDLYLILDALKFIGIHSPNYNGIGHVMQREIVGSMDENYTTMSGFGGMIAFSLAKSPLILIMNIVFILILLILIFYIPLKLRLASAAGISIMCTISFCTSFDPAELTRALLGIIFIYITLRLFNGLKRRFE